MWLLFFHDKEDKKLSKEVARLKEYAEDKYAVKHISYLKFIDYGDDIFYIQHKGNEIGVIMKVEVI